MVMGDNYLAKMKEVTGKTPEEYIPLAQAEGFDLPGTKPGVIIKWLKEDLGLGHGYAMALAHFLLGQFGQR